MNNKSHQYRFASILALAIASCASAAAAQTQEPTTAPDDTASASQPGGLQDIVVTARRKSENLQRTPVSISAVNAEALENLNIRGIDKIAQIAPNVSIAEQSGGIGGNVAIIRGIGTMEPLLTLDSPVGIYLDGVYLGRQSGNNFELVEPERVEVLRGPQGTLFGRNTTGGAINIISRAPSDTFGGTLKAGYASFDEWSVRGALDSGKIGESGLSLSVAGLHRQRNGFVDDPNIKASRDPGAFDSNAAWGKLHGAWGDLKVDLVADWSDQKGDRNPFRIEGAYQPAATYFARSPTFGGDPFPVAADPRSQLPLENAGRQSSKTFGFAATEEYIFSDAFSVKSITAWRGWTAKSPTNSSGNLRGQVVDFTSPTLFSVQRVTPFVSYDEDLRQRQFSQEFQVLGKTGALSYVVGGYYFNERASEFNTNYFTISLPPAYLAGLGYPAAVGTALSAQGIDLIGVNLGQTMRYLTKSQSLAAFGQVSWKPPVLDDRLELTGGIRYTHDTRDIDEPSIPTAQPFTGQLPNPGPTPGPSRTGSERFNNVSYLASANFQWSADFMTYARYATGYKSGGFDARAGVSTITGQSLPFTFKPEHAKSYEVGFKSEFAARRLRVNGDVFYTDYKGLQISQYAGGNGFVPNADAHYTGGELEIVALPVARLQIDGSVGYTKAVYDEFILVDPATGLTGDYRKTAKFPYSPAFTAHAGGQYAIPLSWSRVILRTDYAHSSTRYFHSTTLINPLNNLIRDHGQDLVSARLSLVDMSIGGGSSNLEVSFYGENLLNQNVRAAGIDFGPNIGIAGVNYGQPRRFGVDAKLKF